MCKPFFYWFMPAILWGAIILILTSIPTLHAPSLGMELEDKLYHFIAYFIFGMMLARALIRNGPDRLRRGLMLTVLFGSIFSIMDEWHQIFIPGRSCEAGDAMADILGVLSAIAIFYTTRHIIFNKEEQIQRKILKTGKP